MVIPMRTLFLAVSTAIVLFACPPHSRAGEDYFLLMFGSQRIPNNPDHSHSFATFVKVSWPGDGPCGPDAHAALEADTISWLPESLTIRLARLRAECGHNFELHESIRYLLDDDQRLSLWGPYRIDPELYQRGVNQISLLNSGEVRYKALDTGHHPDHVSNCI